MLTSALLKNRPSARWSTCINSTGRGEIRNSCGVSLTLVTESLTISFLSHILFNSLYSRYLKKYYRITRAIFLDYAGGHKDNDNKMWKKICILLWSPCPGLLLQEILSIFFHKVNFAVNWGLLLQEVQFAQYNLIIQPKTTKLIIMILHSIIGMQRTFFLLPCHRYFLDADHLGN